MAASALLDKPLDSPPPLPKRVSPRAEKAPQATSSPWPLVCLWLAVSLLAGVAHALGWLFPGAWPAAWIGQAALIFIAANNRPRSAFSYGLLCGVIGIASSFYWGIAALQMTIDANLPLAYAIFSGLVMVEGLSFAIFALLVALARRGSVSALWLAPFAWATVEAWYPRIFPWQLGYSQLEMIPLLQIAELTGSIGIGFVMTAMAAVPTIVWLGRKNAASTYDRRWSAWYAIAATALLTATLTFGEIRSRQWTAWLATQPKMKVAAIQVDPAYQGSEERLRNLTLPILEKADLICWPESSIGIYAENLPHFRDRAHTKQLSRDSINSLEPAKDFGRHFLAGGKMYRQGATENGPYFMTAFLIGPEQDVLGRYHKRTLLPFGEYVPLQNYYPAVREWFTLNEVIEAGSDPRPLLTEDGRRLGVLICYEDTRPESGRQTVAAGAQALFSLIQGTAFENPLTLRQHQRLAVMRAVENRRYFVRCASTGVSCIIAPTGQVVAELPMQTEDVLLGEIALLDQQTIYTRTGTLFAWTCTLVLVVGLARISLRTKRAADPSAPGIAS